MDSCDESLMHSSSLSLSVSLSLPPIDLDKPPTASHTSLPLIAMSHTYRESSVSLKEPSVHLNECILSLRVLSVN